MRYLLSTTRYPLSSTPHPLSSTPCLMSQLIATPLILMFYGISASMEYAGDNTLYSDGRLIV